MMTISQKRNLFETSFHRISLELCILSRGQLSQAYNGQNEIYDTRFDDKSYTSYTSTCTC